MPASGSLSESHEVDWMNRVNSLNVKPMGNRSRSSSNPTYSKSPQPSSSTTNPQPVIEEQEHNTMKPLSRSRSIDPNSRVVNYQTAESDDSSLGPALQKIRSTPTFPLNQPQPQKKSWFSKFRRHTTVAQEVPSPPNEKKSEVPESSFQPKGPRESRASSISSPYSGNASRPQAQSQHSSQPKRPTPSVSASGEVDGPASPSSSGFLKHTLRKFKSTPNSVPSSPVLTGTTNTSTLTGTAAPSINSATNLSMKPLTATNSSSSTSSVSSSSTIPTNSTGAARKHSVVSSISSRSTVSSSGGTGSKDKLDPNLDSVSLLRVNFSVDTFKNDPPQQIPARSPKSGNVKFDEATGQIIRPHHSTLDSASPTAYAHAATIAKSSAYNTAVLVANSVRSDARRAARMATINKFTGRGTVSTKPDTKAAFDLCEDEQFSKAQNSFAAATAGNIDGSVSKRSEFPSTAPAETSESEEDEEEEDDKDKPLNLVDLYTRCCHLREILPIQATLRQLQAKSTPLASIQLMNPRPTAIEVLSFADFLSVAPITTLLLDNLDISEEMFKQLILSLTNAEHLFKLSLKNVNLTPNNWKLLCCFLARNKWISKLDISLKLPSSQKKKIKYKKTEFFAREDLDWNLLCHAIIRRGGLEELNINSCYVPHDTFQSLVLDGLSVATKRLGVSCSDLQKQDLDVLSSWISAPTSICEGLDLSGNTSIAKNLGFIRTLFTQKSLLYLSLNSCHLDDSVGFGKIIAETAATLPLRFLDLSFNPLLFPHISPVLFPAMTKMKFIASIYLDFNNLNSQDVLLLADAIPKCSKLGHVSLTGCRDINDAAAEALAVSVKLSSTVSMFNIDPEVLPASIARRLSHYCMQNMESLVDVTLDGDQLCEAKAKPTTDRDGYNFEGEDEIFDDGKLLIKAVSYVVNKNKESHAKPNFTSNGNTAGSDELDLSEPVHACHLSADGLAQRAKRVREKVQIKLGELTKSYKLREMPDPIRDKLVRFWYLDKALEGVIQRYEIASGKVCGVSMSLNDAHHNLPTASIHSSQHHASISIANDVLDHVHKGKSRRSHRINSAPDVSSNCPYESDNSSTETEDNSSSTSGAVSASNQNGVKAEDKPLPYRECGPGSSTPAANSAVYDFDDSTPLPVVAHKIVGGNGTLGMAREEAGHHFVGQDGFLLDDGHDVMQDDYGVCVLPRPPSITSSQVKKQEREEGEFHKMGLIMRTKVLDSQDVNLDSQEDLEEDLTDREADDDSIHDEDAISLSGSLAESVDGGLEVDEELPSYLRRKPSKMVQIAVNKSGDELRELWLNEIGKHGSGEENGDKEERFQTVLQKIKEMSPDEFEQYFVMLDAKSKEDTERLKLEELEEASKNNSTANTKNDVNATISEEDEFEDAPEGNDLVKLDNYSINQQPLKHVASDQEIDPNETQ